MGETKDEDEPKMPHSGMTATQAAKFIESRDELGVPKKAFSETFRAADVVREKFFSIGGRK